MAEHSLREYLKRQSIEELDSLLTSYLQDANYQHVVSEILTILNDRCVPEISPELAFQVKEMPLPKD